MCLLQRLYTETEVMCPNNQIASLAFTLELWITGKTEQNRLFFVEELVSPFWHEGGNCRCTHNNALAPGFGIGECWLASCVGDSLVFTTM